MNIPLAHTQGGEQTAQLMKALGMQQQNLHTHFPATNKSGENINKMGENKNIFNFGCPSIDLIDKNLKLSNNLRKKFQRCWLLYKFEKPYIVVLQHPYNRVQVYQYSN